jgi:riboflavin kinase/FMN adenylyltransferase
VVIHGDKRGREIGFPTLNIALDGDAVPYGIYAGRVLGRSAAVSVGVRPTFGDGLTPLLEVHILDFTGCLYGWEIEVELLEYLRPELKFDSVEALITQIEDDVAEVRRLVQAN